MRKIAGYLTKNRSGKDQKIAQSTHENEYIKPRKTFWRNSKQFLSLSKDLFLFFVTEETFIFAGRMCDCIMQGKVFLRLLALCGGLLCGASLFAQQVRFALNAQTGAVDSL